MPTQEIMEPELDEERIAAEKDEKVAAEKVAAVIWWTSGAHVCCVPQHHHPIVVVVEPHSPRTSNFIHPSHHHRADGDRWSFEFCFCSLFGIKQKYISLRGAHK